MTAREDAAAQAEVGAPVGTGRETPPRKMAPPHPPSRPGKEGVARGAARVADLEELRDEIEEIDRELIRLIARRVEVARAVGEAKRAAGLPTLDPAREAAVVRRAGALAREAGLEDEEARRVFWQLIGLSRRAQEGGEVAAPRAPADAPAGADPPPPAGSAR